MRRNLLLFSVLLCFFFSCKEKKKANVHPLPKKIQAKLKTTKKEVHTAHFIPKAEYIPEEIPKFIPRVPCPPYDPIEPCPIDPPGYIPYIQDPEPLHVQTTPKTIRDSIVNFPATMASFGNNTTDIFKYIDEKIAGSTEWNYLRELGIEGKIYVRLLIDVNGKVREVTFLKFSVKELEMLKGTINKVLFAMPLWSPAKDEKGTAVVSEYTLPVRVSFK